MVSRSRISPTRITSGSSRSAERSASLNPSVSRWTSRWLISAALALVHELDRVLDRDDVVGPVVVDVVDHRGKRGRLARAGGAGDQHQAARLHRDVLEDLRRVQVVERQHHRGNVAEHGGGAAVLVEGVDAEARELRDLERKVGLVELFVRLPLLVIHDVVHHAVHFLVRQRWHVDPLHVAVDSDHGRHARRQVQVGGFVLDGKCQQLGNVDGHRFDSLAPASRVRNRTGLAGRQSIDQPLRPQYVNRSAVLTRGPRISAGPHRTGGAACRSRAGCRAAAGRQQAAAGRDGAGRGGGRPGRVRRELRAGRYRQDRGAGRRSRPVLALHRPAAGATRPATSPRTSSGCTPSIASDIATRLDAQRPHARAAAAGPAAGQARGRSRARAAWHRPSLPGLAAAVAALPRLRLRGLMCIPPPAADFELQRVPFRRLRELLAELNAARSPARHAVDGHERRPRGRRGGRRHAGAGRHGDIRTTSGLSPARQEHQGMSQRILFVGGGNMATSLVGGLRRARHAAESIVVADPEPAQRLRLDRDYGVATVADAAAALDDVQTVVLAVKPQQMAAVAQRARPGRGRAAAAGDLRGGRHPAARPRALARTGHPAGAHHAEPSRADGRGRHRAVRDPERRRRGTPPRPMRSSAPAAPTVWVTDEAQMDAVTAVSGSGPAYFFLLDRVPGRGRRCDSDSIRRRRASSRSRRHVAPACMAAESAETPAELRAQVTSKGGTTAAALERARCPRRAWYF